MSSWYFFQEASDNAIVLVIDGDVKGSVDDVVVGKKVMMLEVQTTSARFLVSLNDFVRGKNSLCQCFKEALKSKSRSAFKVTYEKVRERTDPNSSGADRVETESDSEDVTDSIGSVSSVKSPTVSLHSSTGLQRHLVEDKMLGQCLDVHISNLREPPSTKLTRPLDHQHVKQLEESFMRNPDQLVLLYGCVDDLNVTPEQLRRPGGADVFVIGGNHTRVALQSLMEQGATHIEHVKMSIYRGLSQDDALFLGVHHNQIHEISRPMTFIEKVSLLRKLGAANKKSKKEQEEFLQRLKAIFDYETTTKVRHNMKNHLRLAKVESEVWVLVVKVTQAWNRNIIPCRPQKKTIDQTFFVRLLREDLERQVDLLSTLMESGYREYLKKLNGKTHDVLEGASTQVVESNENIEAENENELMEENSILKDRIRQLEEENEALKNRVQEMDDEVKKLTNKQTVNGRKRKADAEKQMLFEVGGKVDALWRDKNPQATGWYEAVVKEVKENGYINSVKQPSVIYQKLQFRQISQSSGYIN